jgi:hypothetical protein
MLRLLGGDSNPAMGVALGFVLVVAGFITHGLGLTILSGTALLISVISAMRA